MQYFTGIDCKSFTKSNKKLLLICTVREGMLARRFAVRHSLKTSNARGNVYLVKLIQLKCIYNLSDETEV